MLTSEFIALLQRQLEAQGDMPVKILEQTGPDNWRAAKVKGVEYCIMESKPCLWVKT